MGHPVDLTHWCLEMGSAGQQSVGQGHAEETGPPSLDSGQQTGQA